MEFLKCIGAPELTAYALSLLLFLFAYILYRILLFSFRRLFRKDGIWKRLIEAIRYPVLVIFLEIAGLISIHLLGLKEAYGKGFERAIFVVMILTMGFLAASITKALYHHFLEKYENAHSIEASERSMVTQVLFLYRIVMFLICVVTFASILMTFPNIKSVGIGLLSSAGIIGIALGIAARPILLNLMAGFQIAMTKTIKIGDAIFVENDFARIEAIHLTHVIARTWDLRRIVLPISYFIDHPFQNWDTKDPELIGSIFIYCDYTVPFEEIRKKVYEILEGASEWNKKVWRMHVTNCTEKTVELRIMMTSKDASSTFDLRCHVREKLIEFLQKEHPYALPCIRFTAYPDH